MRPKLPDTPNWAIYIKTTLVNTWPERQQSSENTRHETASKTA